MNSKKPHQTREDYEVRKLIEKIEKKKKPQSARLLTVKCPHCGEQTGIGRPAMLDTALMPGKTCERCYLEFLIVDELPVRTKPLARRTLPRG